MTQFKKYISITWPVLYVGLNNNWLSTKEVVDAINDTSIKLNCDEKTLVDINVNDDNRDALLNTLKQKADGKEYEGLLHWQLAHLVDIEQSNKPIQEKLKEIELQWSRFDYPESWRGFIYYLSSESVNTEEGIYQNFLTFLTKEKKRLNYIGS